MAERPGQTERQFEGDGVRQAGAYLAKACVIDFNSMSSAFRHNSAIFITHMYRTLSCYAIHASKNTSFGNMGTGGLFTVSD